MTEFLFPTTFEADLVDLATVFVLVALVRLLFHRARRSP